MNQMVKARQIIFYYLISAASLLELLYMMQMSLGLIHQPKDNLKLFSFTTAGGRASMLTARFESDSDFKPSLNLITKNINGMHFPFPSSLSLEKKQSFFQLIIIVEF